jgi:hypothetical protein
MLNRHQVTAPVFPVLGFANSMFGEMGIDNLSWLPKKATNLAHPILPAWHFSTILIEVFFFSISATCKANPKV